MSIFNGTIAPELYMSFATGAPFTQVDTDDIRQISISRGRSRTDLDYDVGTLTVVLDNNSGIYDPDYTAASPFVSGGVSVIQRGMSMVFAMKWASNYYGQFYGFLENVVINQGLDTTAVLTFTDGLDLLATSIYPASFYKRNSETTADRFQSAVDLSIVGWETRMNLTSTITNAYGTGSAVTYTGNKVYLPGQTVTIQGVNPSSYDLTDQVITSVSGTNFTVANGATGGYVSGGTASIKHVMMQATYGNKTPIAMMREAAECEGMDFYSTFVKGPFSSTGFLEGELPRIVFQPIADKFNRSTMLAFSDSLAAGTVPYSRVDTSASSVQKINKATIAYPDFNSTANLQVTASYDSGDVAQPIVTAPVYNSYAAINLAVYYARKIATPIPMVTSIQMQAITLNTLYPDLLTMDLGDQVSIERTTVDSRAQQYDVVVEGINHYISPNSWNISLTTSGLNPYYTIIDKSGG